MKRSVGLFGFGRCVWAVFTLVVLATVSAIPAQAQRLTPNEAVARLFEPIIDENWFSASFLERVPTEQIARLTQQLTSQFGPLGVVEEDEGRVAARFDNATLWADVVLDVNDRIDDLWLSMQVEGSDSYCCIILLLGFGGVTQAMIAEAAATALQIAQAAQPVGQITTNDAVARLFVQEVEADWFADVFLAQVSVEQIAAIADTFTGEYGPLVAVEGEGGQLTTRFELATMPTEISLDENGRIDGLFFGPPVPIGTDLGGFVADIAALPGETSVLVQTNNTVVVQHEADLPLGVGSAFKLAVLAALIDEVAAGGLAWDDVVELDPAWRSLPTGILQDWPAGTPVTLATLANLMISASDNTATDALIAILGRERVEAESPRNMPFLTTGEMFRLKSVGNEALAEEWLTGDEAVRRALLDTLATLPLPAVEDFPTSPTLLEAEWFMSATEICSLLDRVGDNPAMSINSGVANSSDWARVAFKGGSEPGVLNLSTLVTAHDGATHCVVVTWNDPSAPLDETALVSLYAGILAVLAGE